MTIIFSAMDSADFWKPSPTSKGSGKPVTAPKQSGSQSSSSPTSCFWFTGHGGVLGIRQIARPAPQNQEERDFLESMAKPANLLLYQEKTRENIKALFDWVRRIEKASTVERVRLWSEGEDNFEARLEEILAAR
jgi:hypothetical protein